MSEQVFQTRYETYRTAVESYLETLPGGRTGGTCMSPCGTACWRGASASGRC